MKISRHLLVLFIIGLFLLTSCSKGFSLKNSGSNDKAGFTADKIDDEGYDLSPKVYTVKDGKRSSTALNTIIYPRNLGNGQDTDKDIDYNTIDAYCDPNLVYDKECQKLCLMLTHAPESIVIMRRDDTGEEKKVDYARGKEETDIGTAYTFSFDFSYEGEVSAIYSIKVTFSDNRVLDMAFKLRNGSDKPLNKDAVAINFELEEADKNTLSNFILNCSCTKKIHVHYLMGKSIHVEKLDDHQLSGGTVFKIMTDKDVISYGYLWKNTTGLFYGTPVGLPQVFDVDQDGKKELVAITSWSSASNRDTIYVFDEDENQVGTVSYCSLYLQQIENQSGDYYKIIYNNSSTNDSKIGATSIGSLRFTTDAGGNRRYYIERAEDDTYTDIEAYLTQDSN